MAVLGLLHVEWYPVHLVPEARRWNMECFKRAVDTGVSPIVVDRGNGRNRESQEYARYAVERGYRIELKEPESEWWQEIRVLLKYNMSLERSSTHGRIVFQI